MEANFQFFPTSIFSFLYRVRQMLWTENHDILLLREILNIQPWMHKHGSSERKQTWDEIAAILNSLEEPYFNVKARSVRDRYSLLVKKHKTKTNVENKASGISPEVSELDEALADLIERFNEADSAREKETGKKNNKQAEDLVTAQEMRRKSLETYGESRKRNLEDGVEVSQKRSKKLNTTEYLIDKSQRDYEIRTKELELKEKELALQSEQQQQTMLMMQQQNATILEMFKMMKSKQL